VDLVAAIGHGGVLAYLMPPVPSGPGACRPGAIVGVSRGGEQFLAAFGFADLESGAPIAERTVFDCGSLAKQFTAAAAQLLHERGELDLDRPAAGYLPFLAGALGDARVRDLVQHTSGLRDYRTLLAVAGARRYDFYARADVLGILARQRAPAFPPGSAYEYSNSNYVVLAKLVELAAGRPLGELCRTLLFEPAGMRATALADDLSRVVAHRARSYAATGTGGFRTEFTPSEIVGDAGLLSTVTDLLRWGDWVLGRGNDGRPPVPDLLRAGALADATPIRYGSGLVHGAVGGYACVRHGGSVDGFQAEWLVVPSRALVMVALANWAAAQPGRAVAELVPLVMAGPAPTGRQPGNETCGPRSVGPTGGYAWSTEPVALTGDADEVWQLCPGPDGGYALVGPAVQAYLTGAGGHTLRGEHEGTPVALRPGQPPRALVLRIDGREVALTPVPADAAAERRPLADYAGTYRSAELATEAIVWAEDGRLHWRRRTATEPLTWVTGDWFRAGATWLRFRFDGGRVVALRVDAPRARGMAFVAVPAARARRIPAEEEPQ
jgi:CubicO group peptidase (beta-lactamase class C family)